MKRYKIDILILVFTAFIISSCVPEAGNKKSKKDSDSKEENTQSNLQLLNDNESISNQSFFERSRGSQSNESITSIATVGLPSLANSNSRSGNINQPEPMGFVRRAELSSSKNTEYVSIRNQRLRRRDIIIERTIVDEISAGNAVDEISSPNAVDEISNPLEVVPPKLTALHRYKNVKNGDHWVTNKLIDQSYTYEASINIIDESVSGPNLRAIYSCLVSYDF